MKKDTLKGFFALLVLAGIAAAVYFGFFYEPPVEVLPVTMLLPHEVKF